MADVLRIKRRYTGGAAGAPLTLANGELAYNEVDDKLYYGKGNNAGQATSIIPIAGPGMGYSTGGGGGSSITMADTPPGSPVAGQGWWDSTSGQLYLYFTDPNSSQWVPAFNIPAGAATTPFLPLAGGTLTGNLTISQPTGWSSLTLNTAAGNRNQLNSLRGGVARWGIDIGNDTAETGSNVGTDFVINRFADNGTYLGQALTIYRNTSNVSLAGNFDVGYGVVATAVGLELGRDRSGNGDAFIDLHGASGGGDYDFRIIRNSGLNGNALIENVGTGIFALRGSDLRTTGAIAICYNVSTADACAYIGRYRTGDGYAYIDLHTSADDNFDLRLQRNPGVNGNSSLTNSGTGVFGIYINGVAIATFASGNYSVTLSNTLAAAGIQCRPGIGGTSVANTFNINWTGVPSLWIDNVNVGQITVTSDYRIKENVVDLPTMWDRVKALRPISYTIKDNTRLLSRASPEEEWGFIAHELQETLIPSASTGYKDAPNILQSPNIMTLVAPLARALQEAMERIESLEIKVALLIASQK